MLQRLNQSWQAVLADLLTLLGAVSASIFLYTVIMPGRATLGCGLQGAMETVVSTSPMLALAPALARCRFRPGHLVAFLALMSLSLLGFFGRFSPFRADTVFAATGSVARWLADGMACGACFLISLSFARSRFFETPCG